MNIFIKPTHTSPCTGFINLAAIEQITIKQDFDPPRLCHIVAYPIFRTLPLTSNSASPVIDEYFILGSYPSYNDAATALADLLENISSANLKGNAAIFMDLLAKSQPDSSAPSKSK